MTLNRRSLLLAAAVADRLCIGPAQPASAQTVMKLANATINDGQHEWQKLFVAALQKRIGDKVKTEIYPASQLGAIPRMAEGVSLGTIESFITPTVLRHQPRSAIPDFRCARPVRFARARARRDP